MQNVQSFTPNHALSRIRTAVSVGALVLAGLSHTAWAQDISEEAADENIIIVTAQKKSQDIQNVPLAISAFDSGTIDDKVIDDAVDLSFSVPNLTVDIFGASLRGVGNLAISATSESGLGYHVNGVYLGSAATEAEYYDIERIEVLRGPQGTLYGRNTTAGVLNVITQKATDDFEGYVTAGYGNYNSVKLRGAINLPITDGLSTRVAGFFLDRDGYATNLFTGNDVDDREMFGLRSSTKLEFGDTRADLVISYFREDDRRLARTKVLCAKDVTLGCSPLSVGFETPDSRNTLYNTLGAVTGIIATGFGPAAVDFNANSFNPADTRLINEDVDPTYFVEEWSASLEITHDFGGLTLTSLSGYQEIERELFKDFDRVVPSQGLTAPITFDFFANGNPITTDMILAGRRDLSEAREYYQELRLASDFEGPLNFILGGNYYNRRSSGSANFTHVTIAARQQQLGLPDTFDSVVTESNPVRTKSFGIFGEVYFDLSEDTRLTGGLRYSHDDKTIMTRQIFFNPQPDLSPPDFTFGEFSKGVFTGRIVLDHKITPDLLGYISASRGYKAGGINPGEVGVETQGFDPEFLNAIEVGLKGSSVDGAFTGSLSTFYYDYKDLQIGQTTATAALTINTDATVWGVEAEFAARPSSRFQIDGSFSYLNTQVKDFATIDETDPFGTAPNTVVAEVTAAGVLKDVDGNALPFSPDIKIAIGAQYEIPAGNWTITPRIDHYLQSEFASSIFSKPIDIFDGYSQTDIKLLLAPDSGSWELRGYVKNLFNNDDITRVLPAGRLVGRFREVVILEPRTYGVEATFRF
ncbi:TonB-dependent Receptor Plug Domain [Parasphingorhabdus marina DSM 22363]|uniref:TonB-dependent Receptor Plug Domain n=1 Tax=Parasphingorhabdus marina DSM 22363 TaxID=1123272 RepID=A0A1N6EGS9_9SPHN|nr:TonB-dependent Receptor Plug Domain [Parasphingorhabdus marina DSM 22363]